MLGSARPLKQIWKVQTRLDLETYHRLVALAERRRVSQAELLRLALERLLAEENGQPVQELPA